MISPPPSSREISCVRSSIINWSNSIFHRSYCTFDVIAMSHFDRIPTQIFPDSLSLSRTSVPINFVVQNRFTASRSTERDDLRLERINISAFTLDLYIYIAQNFFTLLSELQILFVKSKSSYDSLVLVYCWCSSQYTVLSLRTRKVFQKIRRILNS